LDSFTPPLTEEAANAYDKALELNSKLGETLYNKSYASFGVIRYEEALEASNQTLKLYPEFEERI
jgi:tetratricopeptide (TPR) repeat protein